MLKVGPGLLSELAQVICKFPKKQKCRASKEILEWAKEAKPTWLPCLFTNVTQSL